MNGRNTRTPSDRSAWFLEELLQTGFIVAPVHPNQDDHGDLPETKAASEPSISLLPAWLNLMIP